MKILSAIGAMAAPLLLAASVQAAPVAFFTTLQYEMDVCNNVLFCVEGDTYDVVLSGTVDIADPLTDQFVFTGLVSNVSISAPLLFMPRPSSLDGFTADYIAPTSPGDVGLLQNIQFGFVDLFTASSLFIIASANPDVIAFEAVGGPTAQKYQMSRPSSPITATTNAVGPSPVPLPAGLALILTGIAGLGLVTRRR